ncbi:phosphatase PAP2 family protein [uncultured Devosia sp.]|uniref:phosphatase PAP2 family protein n=1 Tax=uncultured Devosia sp. TaxID=211434 RepID=UPI0035CA47B7
MFNRLTNSPYYLRTRDFVRGETKLLACIAVISGLVLGFLHLADEMVEGETAAFDNWVLLLFREPGNPDQVIGPLWVQEMVRDITSLGSFACLGLIVSGTVIFLLLCRMRAAALLVTVSVLGGTLFSTLLKMGYNRPRPDLTHLSQQFTASFPSGHAMLSAVTFLTLGALLARLAPTRAQQIFCVVAAMFLTLIVGTSRLYMGVHYPSDVLAGWALGAAWALLCSAVASLLQRQGTVQETVADAPR